MPLSFRGICACTALSLILTIGAIAQNPTSVDLMRSRISKAKGLVAVKNYAAAIYELEGIKRESNDPTVNSVVQVMLMNCYLEQLDYKRAQSLLTEIFNAQKANKPNTNYFVVAGQVVKGARNQVDRYKSLGLSVTDRNLPTEAVADVEKMREMVEAVLGHSKTLGENKQLMADSMAMIEEAGSARSGLARDEYDSRRWKDEVSDAREKLMSSRTTIINAVNDGNPPIMDTAKVVAAGSGPIIKMTPDGPGTTAKTAEPVKSEPKVEPAKPTTETVAKVEPAKPTNETVAKVEPPVNNVPPVEKKVDEAVMAKSVEPTPTVEQPKSGGDIVNTSVEKPKTPLEVGSLIDYAISKPAPTYPPTARSMRVSGTVRVELIVDEDGSIAEIKKASGPVLLQRAATDAAKKWKFKPFSQNGQASKAFGYISFNFADPSAVSSNNSAEEEKPVVEKPREEKKTVAKDDAVAEKKSEEKPPVIPEGARERVVENAPQTTGSASTTDANAGSPIPIGSLIEYATAKVSPTYPPAAKSMRMTGTVRVELVVNEDGSIAEVQKASGPAMLQRAAVDAIKKWKFTPFTRDGQAVKATGYVSFNFNL